MIAALVLAATVAGPQTPQAGALSFLQPVPGVHAIVRVAAQTPNYAVLQFSHAEIEGQAAAGQILVKRFPFGWQAIDLSSGPALAMCSVRAYGLPAADFARLRSVLSASTADCPSGIDADQRDVGAARDVSSVRALMVAGGRSEIVPYVRVVENYAYAPWYGNGGGENFYKKTAAGWKMFAGGGGALQSYELHQHYGVPLSIAQALLRR
jgi:hypothetical protein